MGGWGGLDADAEQGRADTPTVAAEGTGLRLHRPEPGAEPGAEPGEGSGEAQGARLSLSPLAL